MAILKYLQESTEELTGLIRAKEAKKISPADFAMRMNIYSIIGRFVNSYLQCRIASEKSSKIKRELIRVGLIDERDLSEPLDQLKKFRALFVRALKEAKSKEVKPTRSQSHKRRR